MALSVSFHGKYIPLQGVEYILGAAELLRKKDVSFTLIGSGQTFAATKKFAEERALANVTFIGRVPFEELPGMLKAFDVGLGIFGNTDKAARVIPNKVYELAALGKAIVTADTPAIREVFTDKEDILLCRRADAKDLAEKLLLLSEDAALKTAIERGVLETFRAVATPQKIGEKLLAELAPLASRV